MKSNILRPIYDPQVWQQAEALRRSSRPTQRWEA